MRLHLRPGAANGVSLRNDTKLAIIEDICLHATSREGDECEDVVVIVSLRYSLQPQQQQPQSSTVTSSVVIASNTIRRHYYTCSSLSDAIDLALSELLQLLPPPILADNRNNPSTISRILIEEIILDYPPSLPIQQHPQQPQPPADQALASIPQPREISSSSSYHQDGMGIQQFLPHGGSSTSVVDILNTVVNQTATKSFHVPSIVKQVLLSCGFLSEAILLDMFTLFCRRRQLDVCMDILTALCDICYCTRTTTAGGTPLQWFNNSFEPKCQTVFKFYNENCELIWR